MNHEKISSLGEDIIHKSCEQRAASLSLVNFAAIFVSLAEILTQTPTKTIHLKGSKTNYGIEYIFTRVQGISQGQLPV